MKFLIFNGSIRKGQYTQRVTELVKNTAADFVDYEFEVIDLRELDIEFNDEGTRVSPDLLTEMIENAAGYVVITPEYNHAFPGSLKYLLDMNLKQYIHKPIAMVGVSSGKFGGVRAIESLLPVLRELGLVATFTDVYVSNVKDEVVNEKFSDPEKWKNRIRKMLIELFWMAETLQYGRENITYIDD